MQKLARVRQSSADSAGRKALREVSLAASAAKRVPSLPGAAATRLRHRSRSAGTCRGVSPRENRRSMDDGLPLRTRVAVLNMAGSGKVGAIGDGMECIFGRGPPAIHYGP